MGVVMGSNGTASLRARKLFTVPRALPPSLCGIDLGANDFNRDYTGVVQILTKPGLRTLDLSYCKINEIRPFNAQRSALAELSLYGNKFTDSGSLVHIFSISMLRSLDVSSCGLSNLPPIPPNCGLERLAVSFNHFQDSSSLKQVFELNSLMDIELICCEMESLPDFDSNKCQLKVANVSENPFSSLLTVRNLLDVKSLEELDVSCCQGLSLRGYCWRQSKIRILKYGFYYKGGIENQIGTETLREILCLKKLEQLNMLKGDEVFQLKLRMGIV